MKNRSYPLYFLMGNFPCPIVAKFDLCKRQHISQNEKGSHNVIFYFYEKIIDFEFRHSIT